MSDSRLGVWEKRWKANQLRWHKSQINPHLIKYVDLLTSVTSEEGSHIDNQDALKNAINPKNIFIPLCGKTLDIGYILSLGHTVFAVEGVKQAIETLNDENEFNLVFDPEKCLYSTIDGKLKIYCGNIFTCPIEQWGPFDCVWDRGSLTALDRSVWSEYIHVIRRSVEGRRFRYLLVTFDYDKLKADGRGPKCVDEQDIQSLYNEWTNYKLLESVSLPQGHVIRTMVGDESPCFEKIYLLVPNPKEKHCS